MFTILKLIRVVCSKPNYLSYQKKRVIIVLEFEVMYSGAEVGYKIGCPVSMASDGSVVTSGAENVTLDQLAPEQDKLTQKLVKQAHEDIMFSPQVDIIKKKNFPDNAQSKYFIAKEDTEEGVIGGGPVVRNMAIMELIRKWFIDNLKGTQGEKISHGYTRVDLEGAL